MIPLDLAEQFQRQGVGVTLKKLILRVGLNPGVVVVEDRGASVGLKYPQASVARERRACRSGVVDAMEMGRVALEEVHKSRIPVDLVGPRSGDHENGNAVLQQLSEELNQHAISVMNVLYQNNDRKAWLAYPGEQIDRVIDYVQWLGIVVVGCSVDYLPHVATLLGLSADPASHSRDYAQPRCDSRGDLFNTAGKRPSETDRPERFARLGKSWGNGAHETKPTPTIGPLDSPRGCGSA